MKVMGAIKAASLVIWLVATLGVSLFTGLMIASAGGAMHPPLLRVAAPFACDGEFEIESRRYSSRPGQSGVEHRVFCRDAATGSRADITLRTIFAAFLIYSGLTWAAFLALSLLLFFPLRVLFRRLKPVASAAAAGLAAPARRARRIPPRIIFNGREYSNREHLPADARATYDRAVSVFADSDRDGIPDLFEIPRASAEAQADAGARLTKLKELREAGLITEQEYEAQKARILSEL